MTLERDFGGKPIHCGDCQEFFIAPKDRFGEGVVIGDYIIGKRLGQGAMGTVYRAHQRSLDRECALKILNEKYQQDRELSAALIREAQTAARLAHPHIVQCYAVGREEGTVFYAMEFVEGETLSEMLERHPRLSPGLTANILFQIASALDHAWKRQKMVHQDIRPANIIVNADQEAKLADMGLAQPLGNKHQSSSTAHRSRPGFMAPEQILGEPVDHRTDIFGLGIVFYRCLTGRMPFAGKNTTEIAHHVINDPTPNPVDIVPEITPQQSAIVKRMLEKRPEDRYQDYESLLQDLGALRLADPDSVHRLSDSAVRQLQADMNNAPAAPSGAATAIPYSSEPRKRSAKLLMILFFACSAIIGLLSIAAVMLFAGGGQNKPTASVNSTILPAATGSATIRITRVLADPPGFDQGNEWIELSNMPASEPLALDGWTLRDGRNRLELEGELGPGQTRRIVLDGASITLNNRGNTITLFDADGKEADRIDYAESDVAEGVVLTFSSDDK